MRAVASSVALLTLVACNRGAPLTATDIDRAEAAWQAYGVDDYVLELEIEGDLVEEGRFRITVQDGRVTDARRNNKTITTRDPFYTVQGMFKFLRDELEMARQPGKYWQAGPDARIYQQVVFEARASYPKKYLRAVTGTKHNIAIRVRQVRPD